MTRAGLAGRAEPRLRALVGGLRAPLDAVVYTNEVLVVSAMVGALLAVLLASFSGNIDTMSATMGRINEARMEALGEKIGLISSQRVGGDAVMIFTNYGDGAVDLLGFWSDAGQELDCESNNADAASMTVASGTLLEVTCPVDLSAWGAVLVTTGAHNILEADL